MRFVSVILLGVKAANIAHVKAFIHDAARQMTPLHKKSICAAVAVVAVSRLACKLDQPEADLGYRR